MPYSAKDAYKDTIQAATTNISSTPIYPPEARLETYAAKQLIQSAQHFAAVWENEENEAAGKETE